MMMALALVSVQRRGTLRNQYHTLYDDRSYDVTGQFADKPTRGQSTRGLVNSPKRLI